MSRNVALSANLCVWSKISIRLSSSLLPCHRSGVTHVLRCPLTSEFNSGKLVHQIRRSCGAKIVAVTLKLGVTPKFSNSTLHRRRRRRSAFLDVFVVLPVSYCASLPHGTTCHPRFRFVTRTYTTRTCICARTLFVTPPIFTRGVVRRSLSPPLHTAHSCCCRQRRDIELTSSSRGISIALQHLRRLLLILLLQSFYCSSWHHMCFAY